MSLTKTINAITKSDFYNKYRYYKCSLLMLAINNNLEKVIKQLLNNPTINKNKIYNKTCDSCYTYDATTNRYTIINDGFNFNDSPLLSACRNKMSEIATLLLQKESINYNHYNTLNITPLMWACYNVLVDVCHLLMNKNDIDYNRINFYGNTALQLAATS